MQTKMQLGLLSYKSMTGYDIKADTGFILMHWSETTIKYTRPLWN